MTATTSDQVTSLRSVFDSEGSRLVAKLFTPSGATGLLPGVVVTGTWTSVKEQMADRYAEEMARRGFAAMTFDFHGFGESGGAPRDVESPSRKVVDIRHAVTHLASQPGVDASRLASLAVCASAGYASVEALDDDRVKALALIAPWLHDADIVRQTYGGDEGVRHRLQAGERARQLFDATDEVQYVPMVSGEDPNAAIPFAVDFYLNPDRGALPQWPNRWAVMAWPEWLAFDPIASAARLRQPTLLVHSPDAAIPDGARRFDAALNAPHRTVWLQGDQFDFYDGAQHVRDAADLAAKHVHSVL